MTAMPSSEGAEPDPQLVISDIFKYLLYVESPVSLGSVNNWLHQHDLKLGAFVNGAWLNTSSEECTIFYQRKPLCSIRIQNMDEIDEVVHSAFSALPNWKDLSGDKRSKYLHNIGKLIEEKKELLAVLESLSFKKMIHKTRTQDLPNLIQSLHHFAGLADVWKNEMLISKASGVFSVVLNPNQNPMMSMCWNVCSALASGNCVILIPKASSCLSALLFAEICHLSGLPPGVLNVFPFQTEQECLKLLQHLCAFKVLNTEYTNDLEICSCYEFKLYYDSIKGNFDTRILNVKQDLCSIFPPTAIVLTDADLNSAVVGILELFCFKNGPTNTLCSILVQDSVRDELILKLQSEFSKIQIGSCLSSADVAPTTHFFKEPVLRNYDFDCQVMCLKSSEDDFYDNLYTLDIEKSANKVQVLKLTLSSFRTSKEAVEIFNNQNGRQNVSLWSENISTVLEVARNLKSGTVWVNCQNHFDPASGFGFSYLDTSIRQGKLFRVEKPLKNHLTPIVAQVLDCDLYGIVTSSNSCDPIICGNPNILSQTKLFYGGTFKDPIESTAFQVINCKGELIGSIAKASTKDANLAVESARASQTKWGDTTSFQRSKILHKLAEYLENDKKKFTAILEQCDFSSAEEISKEILSSIECLLHWSTYCSSHGGVVLNTQIHGLVMESREPLGIITIICPNTPPLLGFVSLFSSAIANRNTVVIVPSRIYPVPALEMCVLFQKAGVPAGVINVISSEVDQVCRNFALNLQVDAIWFHHYSSSGHAFLQKNVVKLHKKKLWVPDALLWLDSCNLQDLEFIHHATFNKTIWVPTAQLL